MKKTKAKSDPVARFMALSDAERDAEVARFDKPLPLGPDGLPGKPLTPAMQARWDKIQKRLRRGRPVIGGGAKVLSVSIESGLLKKADGFAKRHKMNRSQMVAEALRLLVQRRAG
jgi:hypothetical protein